MTNSIEPIDLCDALAESIEQRLPEIRRPAPRRRPLISSSACPNCGYAGGHASDCQIGGEK